MLPVSSCVTSGEPLFRFSETDRYLTPEVFGEAFQLPQGCDVATVPEVMGASRCTSPVRRAHDQSLGRPTALRKTLLLSRAPREAPRCTRELLSRTIGPRQLSANALRETPVSRPPALSSVAALKPHRDHG